MNENLYAVLTTCPICQRDFNVIKVKTAGIKLDHTDEDFCMHYKELNPLLYEPWICSHCGYAGFSSNFDKVTDRELSEIKKLCLNKFTDDPTKNPFELTEFHQQVSKYLDLLGVDGERDYPCAIEAFDVLLRVLTARKAPNSLIAKAYMNVGWLFRQTADPREFTNLRKAADAFVITYQTEPLPIGKFDGINCSYMIGELYRRVGNFRDAMDWFAKVIQTPKSAENSAIIEKTRDQIQAIKNSPEYKQNAGGTS